MNKPRLQRAAEAATPCCVMAQCARGQAQGLAVQRGVSSASVDIGDALVALVWALVKD